MGAACYTSMTGATSKDLYPLILIGIGSCVLRLCGGSHLRSPNSIEAWELRATPLCGSHLQNPYPCMWALWGHIIVHICLWGVSMVFMRWWPLGLATCMPNIWLFFPGYTWIDIVHDSEGSLSMDHDFCLWNLIIRFHRYWLFIIIVFTFMAFKHNDFKIVHILDKILLHCLFSFHIWKILPHAILWFFF